MPPTLRKRKQPFDPEVDERGRAAAARFLAIPELVELALSFVPMADLLRAQAVCRLFKTLINTSVRLQTLLFFRPATDHSLPITPNPLLLRHFALLFDHGRSQRCTGQNGRPSRFSRLEFPWCHDAARRDPFLRREASWRRMLVTQPPVVCTISDTQSSMGGRYGCTAVLRDADTIRRGHGSESQPVCMGTIYDVVLEYTCVESRSFPEARLEWIPRDKGKRHQLEEGSHPPLGTLNLRLHMTQQCSMGDILGDLPKHFFSKGHEGEAILEDAIGDKEYERVTDEFVYPEEIISSIDISQFERWTTST